MALAEVTDAQEAIDLRFAQRPERDLQLLVLRVNVTERALCKVAQKAAGKA